MNVCTGYFLGLGSIPAIGRCENFQLPIEAGQFFRLAECLLTPQGGLYYTTMVLIINKISQLQ